MFIETLDFCHILQAHFQVVKGMRILRSNYLTIP